MRLTFFLLLLSPSAFLAQFLSLAFSHFYLSPDHKVLSESVAQSKEFSPLSGVQVGHELSSFPCLVSLSLSSTTYHIGAQA